jgi:cellulose/xylan binding protein with CBM9 domain
MNRLTASISILLCVLGMLALTRRLLSANETATIFSVRAATQSALTADPDSSFWKPVQGVFAKQDTMGNPVTKEVMEIRSRWTQDDLYLLFICAYDFLYLKPDPDPAQETNRLWNWDVAEAFIGSDFKDINRYKEFEVSPQGEWVDLDIDRNKSGGSPDAWRWNSGFKVKARIDKARKVWYAEMCIPFQSISRNPAKPGLQLRINFFRTQGSGPNRLLLTWRPTHARTFHVPAAFGILQLVPETKDAK